MLAPNMPWKVVNQDCNMVPSPIPEILLAFDAFDSSRVDGNLILPGLWNSFPKPFNETNQHLRNCNKGQ